MSDLNKLHEKLVSKNVLVEIGPGHMPGGSILDLSLNVRKRVESGEQIILLDSVKKNLTIPSIGAVAHMSMAKFIKSDYLNDAVETMYIANVFGDNPDTSRNSSTTRTRVRGLAKKLVPGSGEIIIIENYTPDVASALKTLPFGSYGLDAEIISGVDEYREKLQELGISESGYARISAAQHSEMGHSWIPFIVILRRKI